MIRNAPQLGTTWAQIPPPTSTAPVASPVDPLRHKGARLGRGTPQEPQEPMPQYGRPRTATAKGSNAFISRRPGGDGMQPIADLTGVLDLALRRHEAYGFTQLLHPIYTLAGARIIASRHSTSGRRPVIGVPPSCEWGAARSPCRVRPASRTLHPPASACSRVC
jgi:hypothetical protein